MESFVTSDKCRDSANCVVSGFSGKRRYKGLRTLLQIFAQNITYCQKSASELCFSKYQVFLMAAISNNQSGFLINCNTVCVCKRNI